MTKLGNIALVFLPWPVLAVGGAAIGAALSDKHPTRGAIIGTGVSMSLVGLAMLTFEGVFSEKMTGGSTTTPTVDSSVPPSRFQAGFP